VWGSERGSLSHNIFAAFTLCRSTKNLEPTFPGSGAGLVLACKGSATLSRSDAFGNKHVIEILVHDIVLPPIFNSISRQPS
jgi:hypothetical protein